MKTLGKLKLNQLSKVEEKNLVGGDGIAACWTDYEKKGKIGGNAQEVS